MVQLIVVRLALAIMVATFLVALIILSGLRTVVYVQ